MPEAMADRWVACSFCDREICESTRKRHGFATSFSTTEGTEVFPGEACLTWFLEFGIWSLMKLGVFTIGNRAWYSVGVLPQSWAVVLYPSAGLSPLEC